MDAKNYFEKNAEILKKINPVLLEKILVFRKSSGRNSEQDTKLTFELLPAKTGMPHEYCGCATFKINGITVHSAYDPVAEGKKWAASVIEKYAKKHEKPEKIIIFGLGFGYHIKELIKLLEDRFGEINPHKISVVEPSMESLNFILSSCDVSELLYNEILISVSEKDIVFGETDRHLFELI